MPYPLPNLPMKQGVSALLLTITLVITATAAPNPQSQSIKQNISSFVGTQFGSTNLCPLPSIPAGHTNNAADWRLGSLSALLTEFSHTHGGNADDIQLCLTDFQNFLLSQHLDDAQLEELKTFISHLPIDQTLLVDFEHWLQTLGTLSNDTVAVEEPSANRTSSTLSVTSADQQVTAVPEPGTVNTLIFGFALLGGVLLRVRRSAR